MARKVSLSNLVLLTLEKSVEGYLHFKDFTYNSHLYARGYDRPLKKGTLSQALRRLRVKGYIDINKFQEGIIVKLTDKGQEEAIIKKILSKKDWDKKWRIVVFDIPEEHRKIRNILRSKLKLWEFIPWQKSVWASKKEVSEILRKFIKELGIEKWVLVIESDNVGLYKN